MAEGSGKNVFLTAQAVASPQAPSTETLQHMHSFLQGKLKNLHGEARVWGSSTPRPPLLIVQPKGGLSLKAGSRVHGASVPGGERFARAPGRARGRSAAGAVATAGGGGSGAARQGAAPWGDRDAATPPRESNLTLWDFSKKAAGLTLTRCRRPEGRGRGPALALASCTCGRGHPLRSCSQRPRLRDWRKLKGAPAGSGRGGAARPARKAAFPAGCVRAEGESAWESGGREAPAGRAGPRRLRSVRNDSREPAGRVGVGRKGCGVRKLSGTGGKSQGVPSCGGALMWESGYLDFFMWAL